MKNARIGKSALSRHNSTFESRFCHRRTPQVPANKGKQRLEAGSEQTACDPYCGAADLNFSKASRDARSVRSAVRSAPMLAVWSASERIRQLSSRSRRYSSALAIKG